VFKDLLLFETFQLGREVEVKNLTGITSPGCSSRTWEGWEAFWRQTLKGFTTPIPVAARDRRDPNRDTHFKIEVRLSAEDLAALQSLARQNQVTLSTLFQGAWALLLSASSGLEDVVFGTFSGRPASSMALSPW